MGCQTGFYFLVRDMLPQDAIDLIRDTLSFVAQYEGEIPGASRVECGNYQLHDLDGCRKLAISMIPVLKDWTVDKLIYEN